MIEMGLSEFVGNRGKSMARREQHLEQRKRTKVQKDGGWMWMRGETIGRGSFGTVSFAITRPTNKNKNKLKLNIPPIMAVKSAEISVSHSLEKERMILSQLQDCPQILRCYGHDITSEKGVLVYNVLLEYASGGSLADRIGNSGGGLPEIHVRRFTRSLLQGLSHIHGRGCVHCDIKPQNILLAPSSPSSISSGDCIKSTKRSINEEITKISDFGLAKKVGQKKKMGDSGINLRGTPMYISPESVVSNEHEPHSDIWALGCTVVEMITGKPAWNIPQDTTVFSLLHRIGYSQELPDIPGEMSKEAQDFVKKCLVRDSKCRWTADMLLGHPFVATISKVINEAEDRTEGATLTAAAAAPTVGAIQSPTTAFDFPQPKPNFQADCIRKLATGKAPNWSSSSTDWIVVRKAESPVSSQSDKCPVCRKRKRIMGDFKEVVELPTINTSATNYGPQHLQRYWGIRGFEAASRSFDAIPFGF
ncbi:hypothetical protein HHK36_001801 [Tetracentron sinense]|uniref:Protein kinase domain-containing protein n=1 Tax=Tetracentron sinense TaxID=13715 RepID=A0A835DSD9_TETSI|nr:hypothetical protein HHK36_001801 [Tetracentron sinense]